MEGDCPPPPPFPMEKLGYKTSAETHGELKRALVLAEGTLAGAEACQESIRPSVPLPVKRQESVIIAKIVKRQDVTHSTVHALIRHEKQNDRIWKKNL